MKRSVVMSFRTTEETKKWLIEAAGGPKLVSRFIDTLLSLHLASLREAKNA